MIRVPGATVDPAIVDDPLLGPAHVVTSGGQTTTMSAIDWDRPTKIPTVAAPAKLAPGAGGALMNLIAERARDAGVPALRYSGRYPTAALFRTLLRSFRTTATEEAFTSQFRLAGNEVEIPIDFVPAPHVRIDHAHGFVEKRDVIERAVVDGISYERDGSPARLVAVPHTTDGFDTRIRARATLWFGDELYAAVAVFDVDGTLLDGPRQIPACPSPVLGRVFPPALVVALADVVASAVPEVLAEDARVYLTRQTIRWADLGARAAVHDRTGFAVHAVLWERIAPLGLPRLALALAEALAPVVTRALVREIAGDVALMSPPA